MKKIKLVVVKTVDGKAFTTQDGDKTREATIVDLIKGLIFALPRETLTMEDSIRARNLLTQLTKTLDDIVPIEEAEHDWIKTKVSEFGPRTFGVNAVMVRDALDNFERAKEK